ncbi:UDP-3-O-[3-hydroxymyristoyl] N-acetylglucosamine deacetylase, partial [Paramagnetospirillum caucaseum]
ALFADSSAWELTTIAPGSAAAPFAAPPLALAANG